MKNKPQMISERRIKSIEKFIDFKKNQNVTNICLLYHTQIDEYLKIRIKNQRNIDYFILSSKNKQRNPVSQKIVKLNKLSVISMSITIAIFIIQLDRNFLMQGEQSSIVKSIIYGNPTQTSYGLFRSLCSAINHKDHIDKIIFYLRSNANFKKYNKFVYAFRLQLPTNQTFITEERRPDRQKYIDGYNDDVGLQGNGQKLLNLLKKFNVRNVLVIVAIRQKDPLRDFHSEHYVQIVKCAKDLLSSLYDKVVQSKQGQLDLEQQISYEQLPIKQFNIPLQTFYQKSKQKENPNYVGQQFIRKVEQPSNKKLISEMEYLNLKIEELANKLEDVIEDFLQIEDTQVEFAVRYDKNKDIIKVFDLLAELFGLNKKEDIIDQIKKYNGPSRMSNFLRSITMHSITSERIRKLNQQLMSNLNLKQEKVKNLNPICGMIMKFIEILLKSYSFARRLALIQSQIQGEQYNNQEVEKSDKNSSSLASSKKI